MFKNVKTLQIVNIVMILLTLIMNGLSNNREIFETTVGDLGESRAVFFLPDGYVFAIWGLIYTGLIGFTIYQMRSVARETKVVEKVGWWFAISSIGNIVWLVLFLNNEIWLSTVAMFVILGSLLMIYRRLEIGQRDVDWQERWAVHIPFSIYLGWISVATIANISTGLYELDFVTSFLGIGADIWAVVMMVIAGILGIVMLWQRRDIAYALVIAWALFGINARSFQTDLFDVLSSLNVELVNTTALVMTVVVGLAVVVVVGRNFASSAR